MDDSYTVRVGEEMEFKPSGEALASLDVVKMGTDGHHLIKEGRGYRIKWLKSDFNKGRYLVEINGKKYETSLETPLDQLIKTLGFQTNGGPDVDSVIAPMPGLLLEVLVQVGDRVEKGDRLLVLEAMKMENIIGSPREGTIKKIMVGQGDTVDKKQLLLEIE